jgi:hypothetical protein
VKWYGTEEWGIQMDPLYWSPKVMQLQSYEITPKHGDTSGGNNSAISSTLGEWCRIEEFCWVLEPERLCEVITGQNWQSLKTKLNDNESAESVAFSRQLQLVEYYVGQLNLLAKQCYGRSYNCIDWMQRSFSYDMLCSICYNVYLPPKVRAAACDFVNHLYLDRYPQLPYCGKPSLPEQLWVYEISPPSSDVYHQAVKGPGSNGDSHKDLDMQIIPLIKPIELSQAGSLAEFAITKSHRFYNNKENIFHGFPTGFKFFLLRNLCNQYLASFGNGSICHANVNENQFAHRIAVMISSLMSFGFQSSHAKIKDLLHHLVSMLDGRSDVESQVGDKTFQPLSKRFQLSPSSPQVRVICCCCCWLLFFVF